MPAFGAGDSGSNPDGTTTCFYELIVKLLPLCAAEAGKKKFGRVRQVNYMLRSGNIPVPVGSVGPMLLTVAAE